MTTKEKPILFSTPMVQAILRGEKTQTRRVVNPKYLCGNEDYVEHGVLMISDEFGDFYNAIDYLARYKVGDTLWVRETWKPGAWLEDGRVAVDYKASPELTKTPWIENFPGFERYYEKWTNELLKKGLKSDSDGCFHWDHGKSPLNWRPSIFMPRAAARIFLEVVNVRVERLHDITEEDAIAEGVGTADSVLSYGGDSFISYTWHGLKHLGFKGDDSFNGYSNASNARESFQSLWYSINGKESWDDNPFVFVYEFGRVEI